MCASFVRSDREHLDGHVVSHFAHDKPHSMSRLTRTPCASTYSARGMDCPSPVPPPAPVLPMPPMCPISDTARHFLRAGGRVAIRSSSVTDADGPGGSSRNAAPGGQVPGSSEAALPLIRQPYVEAQLTSVRTQAE